MSLLSKLAEMLPGKKAPKEMPHIGPTSAPPGSPEAVQSRVGQLTKINEQQATSTPVPTATPGPEVPPAVPTITPTPEAPTQTQTPAGTSTPPGKAA